MRIPFSGQTERLLPNLVRSLYSRRVIQVAESLPVEQISKDAPLDAIAEASSGGHDLGEWGHGQRQLEIRINDN